MSLTYTKVADVKPTVERCRRGFNSNATRPIAKRKELLRTFIKMMEAYDEKIQDALHKDLRKHTFESRALEIGMIKNEAWEMIDNIDEWSKGERPALEGIMKIEDCKIERDPLGVVLVIGAWNYPFQVTLLPVVGALAAGNTVVIKPSEVAEHSAALMAEMVTKFFSPDIIGCVNGAIKETSAILEEKFDHIIYTGSGRVGRIIMGAAAKHLTPVTLELGGKSPTIVDEISDITTVAQRIMWGKTINAGQTCIAPDYILVKKGETKKRLTAALNAARTKFYGENVEESSSYCRIINDMHYQRLKGLLKHGNVVVGGETNDKTRFIAPTVVENPDPASPLMQDEIFGPVLPMIEIDSAQDAIDYINARDKPLAMYIFSDNSKFSESIISNTSAGGVVVNDTMMHSGVSALPFGGVGGSGTGAYHGKHSFELFSHKKAVMRRKMMLEAANGMRYAPYTENNFKIMSMLLFKNGPHKWYLKYIIYAAIGTVAYFQLYKRFFA